MASSVFKVKVLASFGLDNKILVSAGLKLDATILASAQ